MSVLELKLSPKARQDFVGTLRYTLRKWGPKQQVLIYREVIAEGLESVWRDPGVGLRHKDLPKTHRTHSAGSHVIVYRKNRSVVEVIRILHRRMDPSQHV